MEPSWLNALYGGALIGAAAVLLMLTYGRILGVSGIVGKILDFSPNDTSWRVVFVMGTIVGGFIASMIWPDHFVNMIATRDFVRIAIAGLLVGFGTRLGSGCTSGHGICGVGRMSIRGITATCMFILTGTVTVLVFGR